jgi:two-component system response regulator AtoC
MIAASVLDIAMPRMNGLDTLRQIRKENADVPIIVLSGITAPGTVVEAMKSGATDYLIKPITHEELCVALKKSLNGAWLSGPSLEEYAGYEDPDDVCNVGWSRLSTGFVQKVGPSDVPVLILGETGTGKEVLARRLHTRSLRAQKPFLKLNCAALPSELVESELFGYDRGAFTGAVQRKAGMFELADGGTLLLDEIGDMDPKLQAKLLQVLQDQTFQHLGGKEMVQVNVRILAATHRNLEQAISSGMFREDLYYRLNVVSIQIPPLRERRNEILALAEHFLRKYGQPEESLPLLTSALRRALLEYHWPGNIRQLENVMRRYTLMREADSLALELQAKGAPAGGAAAPAAPEPLRNGTAPAESILEQVHLAKESAEADAILAALNSTHWNRKQAAAMLGIEYKALLYRMKKLAVENANTSPPRGVSRTRESYHERAAAAGAGRAPLGIVRNL